MSPVNSGTPDAEKSFSAFLDVARALAAFAVFAEHLRAPLFPGWPQLPPGQQNLAVRSWFFVTGFGLEAVIVFFVLSGFLVGGRGVDKIANHRWSLREYTIDRISRVYVVLLPALLLTILFDQAGEAFFASTGLWDGTSPNLLQKFATAFVVRDTAGLFACNAVMLQSFYCTVLGSNIPLWTLSYEVWFYVAFALAATMWQARGEAKRQVLVPAVLITLLVGVLGMGFVWMLAIWALGIAACRYRGARFRYPLLALVTWLALATVSRLIDVGKPGALPNNLMLLAQGAAFAWVVVSFRYKHIAALCLLAGVGKKAAGFSHTVYLIHFPAMLLLLGLLSWSTALDIRHGVLPATAIGIGLYVAILAGVMILAWALASVTEGRTAQVRAWMRTTFSR